MNNNFEGSRAGQLHLAAYQWVSSLYPKPSQYGFQFQRELTAANDVHYVTSTHTTNMSRTRWWVAHGKMAVVLLEYGFNDHLVIMVSNFKGS
jgi:hypothetical protein